MMVGTIIKRMPVLSSDNLGYRCSDKFFLRYCVRFFLFFFCLGLASFGVAQTSSSLTPSLVDKNAGTNNDGSLISSSSRNGSALFVPSVDVTLPTSFSSVDAARRNRPPEPSKTKEELFYPDGFLTLSSPTPSPSVGPEQSESDSIMSFEPKEDGIQLRPLDPSVETTPSTVVPTQESEHITTKKVKVSDRFFFLAFSVALAGLGFFLYHEYRYREQLRSDLIRNARLCSPSATPADFDAILETDTELIDPHSLVLANHHLEPNSLLFDSVNQDSRSVSDLELAGFNSVNCFSGFSHNGPGLAEENFDFTPSDNSVIVQEPRDDFIVGGGKETSDTVAHSTIDARR